MTSVADSDLTRQDIDVLIEALTKWEAHDTTGMLMDSIVGGLLKDDPKWKEDAEVRERERKASARARQLTSIRIKGKLLGIYEAVAP